MGFRFRKSFKIAPGIRLNVSKSGLSTSIGGRGATVNVGRGKVRTTVGIPGTGISYSHSTKASGGDASTKDLIVGIAFIIGLIAFAALISKFF